MPERHGQNGHSKVVCKVEKPRNRPCHAMRVHEMRVLHTNSSQQRECKLFGRVYQLSRPVHRVPYRSCSFFKSHLCCFVTFAHTISTLVGLSSTLYRRYDPISAELGLVLLLVLPQIANSEASEPDLPEQCRKAGKIRELDGLILGPEGHCQIPGAGDFYGLGVRVGEWVPQSSCFTSH